MRSSTHAQIPNVLATVQRAMEGGDHGLALDDDEREALVDALVIAARRASVDDVLAPVTLAIRFAGKNGHKKAASELGQIAIDMLGRLTVEKL